MKKVTSLLFVTFMTTIQAAPLELTEVWEDSSDPEIMSYFLKRNFHTLPLSGTIRAGTKYWSGNHWAFRKGNINFRWNGRVKIGFNLNSPSKERARSMSIPEIAELSPSEKYDLFTGRYDYPLRNEVDRIADPGALFWEGICHGWAPATMNHEEPYPKLMRNPDGIEIPFGSTDIKALISYYYAYGPVTPNHQMGRRCYKKGSDKDCHQDMNAGAFHLVLANRLGLKGIGFIADIQRYEEVWNHPIVKYNSVIMRQGPARVNSAPNTAKIYRLKTSITYLDENGNDWQVVLGTSRQSYNNVQYEYDVELDYQGNIVGGEWISNARPDFLWMRDKITIFGGTLARLGELLND